MCDRYRYYSIFISELQHFFEKNMIFLRKKKSICVICTRVLFCFVNILPTENRIKVRSGSSGRIKAKLNNMKNCKEGEGSEIGSPSLFQFKHSVY